MSPRNSFSRRNGLAVVAEAPITIRGDAPFEFRGVFVDLAYDYGFTPKMLRELVCHELRKRPDSQNWGDDYVDQETRGLVDQCEWPKVYDLLELVAEAIFGLRGDYAPGGFPVEINRVFLAQGIGWQLDVNHQVVFRGPEGLESILSTAPKAASNHGHNTAANELHEALRDMSRRPNPDVTGAIQHAIASLECVAREVSGSKETLGAWLTNHRDAFPKPLGEYVGKIWGFASERGRHLTEDGAASIEEAELVLGLSAVLGSYLAKKGKAHQDFQ